jgi:hypothetical protein
VDLSCAKLYRTYHEHLEEGSEVGMAQKIKIRANEVMKTGIPSHDQWLEDHPAQRE